ncbi:MAG TPA: tape measure protein, partial [Acidobacteriota bacterium]
LKFENAGKGISDISKEASKLNLSKIASAVEGISGKFKTLGVVGVTAIANITTKAITTAGRLIKSLSLQQVIDGFKEYETNIGSIQTILANTKDQGATLKDVNSALDQLNTYSDKTIYNFGQMAKNIGTFTAAGVDLDTSVQSIKGIANLAAISGSSSEQASTAMYQLSQAISTGTLKLQDWNSVTNAGMGGKVFQKALFETGKALGTIKDTPIDQTFDQWTDAGNTFRGSLQEGWLTSEVLTTTLQGFTGEMTKAQLKAKGFTDEQAKNIIELGKTGVDAATQVRTLSGLIDTTKEAIGSGWSASFRIVFGNFEEATKLFTGISQAVGDMVGKSAKARNELLQGWKDLGGRTLLIETLKTTIKNLGKILKPIKDAFREVFPPATAKDLFKLTKRFNDFAKALKPSKDTIFNISRIFRGFFNILSLGWNVIKQTAKFIKFLFNTITGPGSGSILEFFGNIFGFFSSIKTRLVEGKGLNRFFKELRQAVKEALPPVKEFVGKVVDAFIKFGKAAWALIPVIKSFIGKAVDAFRLLKDVIVALLPVAKQFINKFLGAFKGFDIAKIIKDPIPFLKDLKDRIVNFFTGIKPKAPEAINNVMDRFKQRFETLRKIL